MFTFRRCCLCGSNCRSSNCRSPSTTAAAVQQQSLCVSDMSRRYISISAAVSFSAAAAILGLSRDPATKPLATQRLICVSNIR